MPENLFDNRAFVYQRDYLHFPAAVGTFQGINFPYLLDQLPPFLGWNPALFRIHQHYGARSVLLRPHAARFVAVVAVIPHHLDAFVGNMLGDGGYEVGGVEQFENAGAMVARQMRLENTGLFSSNYNHAVSVFAMAQAPSMLGDYEFDGTNETAIYDAQGSIFTNQYYYQVYAETTYSNTVLTPMMGTTNFYPLNWGPAPAEEQMIDIGYVVHDVFFLVKYDCTNGFSYE